MRLPVTVALCVLVLALAPFVGPSLDGDSAAFVITWLRVPRVLLGALVGAVLGLVGAAFQTVFDNPLATPSTTGTTAGASLGALAVILALPASTPVGTLGVAAGAFAGALAVTLAVSAVAASGRARVDDVLLAGIALTLAASAVTTGLQMQADMAATFRAVRWSLGSLSVVGFTGPALVLPFAAVTVTVLLSQVRALETLAGGEALAHSQGVDVRRVRTLVLSAGALGVAATVAWCGPIAFVGLVVPHVVRRTLGATRRVLLPLSAVTGAAFLVACDAVARVLLGGRELPVGVLTAALGAPLLVGLALRRR